MWFGGATTTRYGVGPGLSRKSGEERNISLTAGSADRSAGIKQRVYLVVTPVRRSGCAASEGDSVRGSPCDEPARLRFTSLRPPPAAYSAGPPCLVPLTCCAAGYPGGVGAFRMAQLGYAALVGSAGRPAEGNPVVGRRHFFLDSARIDAVCLRATTSTATPRDSAIRDMEQGVDAMAIPRRRTIRSFFPAILALTILPLFAGAAFALDNGQCLDCHGDPGILGWSPAEKAVQRDAGGGKAPR